MTVSGGFGGVDVDFPAFNQTQLSIQRGGHARADYPAKLVYKGLTLHRFVFCISESKTIEEFIIVVQ